jgi:hypothetical protein
MHLAIALVTYYALVLMAPIRVRRGSEHRRVQPVGR